MRFLYILAGFLFIFLYSAINYYLGLRMWQFLWSYVPFLGKKLYWIVFWILALSYVIVRINYRIFPKGFYRLLEPIGAYWLGIIFYLTIILLVVEVIIQGDRLFKILPQPIRSYPVANLIIGLTVFTTLVVIMVHGTFNARRPRVVQYDITIEKKSDIDELNAVLVSDIHLGNLINNSRLRVMVEAINELNPDIVFLAGDIVDENIEPFINQGMSDTFAALESKYGVYAVLGNHEYIGGQVEEIVSHLKNSGVYILRDDYIKIEDSFYVVGREDIAKKYFYKEERKQVSEIVENIDKNLPIILMDHQPKDFQEAYESGVDLQLSGHTHRGQFFPNHIVTRKIYELDWGYLDRDGLHVVVTSGYGTWGPPIRVGNQPEIVNIRMRFAE